MFKKLLIISLLTPLSAFADTSQLTSIEKTDCVLIFEPNVERKLDAHILLKSELQQAYFDALLAIVANTPAYYYANHKTIEARHWRNFTLTIQEENIKYNNNLKSYVTSSADTAIANVNDCWILRKDQLVSENDASLVPDGYYRSQGNKVKEFYSEQKAELNRLKADFLSDQILDINKI